MEKPQPKLKNRILKILPKAAAAVTMTFQNPPFSPGRDHKRSDNTTTRWFKHPGGKGFSGPLIPAEARRKPKEGGIDSQEPTSPKVSCMGQIKNKKKKIKKVTSMSLPKYNPVAESPRSSTPKGETKHASTFKKIFHHGVKPAGRKSDASDVKKGTVPERAAPAPNLSQMKRFASGRDTLAKFDWKAQVSPEEEMEHHDYYSDEDRVDSGGEGEEEVIIPFSAPIRVAGGRGGGDVSLQPRKEINLWKRRTMEPPRPLQLNTVKRTS